MKTFTVTSATRNEMIDITARVADAIALTGVRSGICYVFVPHTTAAVTINENADPVVPRDILAALSKAFPEQGDYRHAEGNSDAHIKTSLVGSSVPVFVENGRLVLGTWQSIFLCEFDGPRTRTVHCSVLSAIGG
ncbi:MAG TPA: secondary thiamine-phosphate synthase enzyme YjbQ [Dissulfurispiraceae bacterium]|nr:secondary thiamine-phosphate synthase enzyme YjbQ [Dissulfurispiraceae bacterium]